MLKKMIATITVTLGIAILTACSGEEPASETGIKSDEPRREATVAAPANTTAPEPTRPQRLDQLLTPAAATKEATVESATKTTQRERKNGAEPTPTSVIEIPKLPIVEVPAISDMVPEDPETNDQVLLQDIYGQIDLEQFALDPNEPIPAAEERLIEYIEFYGGGEQLPVSRMNYEETRDHPYLHLFPHLKSVIENGDHSEEIHYHPLMEADESYSYSAIYRKYVPSQIPSENRSHLLYFIYNPWFNPILEEFHLEESPRRKYRHAEKITPYWFGNNSTRGVLVETVAALLEEAKIPTAEPATRPWTPDKEDAPINIYRREINTHALTEREWTMEEYIRMPVQPRLYESAGRLRNHQAPVVQWEILHPRLPILKITAHASQHLPLKPSEADRAQDYTKATAKTEYSVSFVMSLQNRWTSFDEPDRWIIRFQEDLQTAYSSASQPISIAPSTRDGFFPPHLLDQDLPYPNYWDDTDYMQHRIIGPVVLTVHESPVLQPGTYNRIPRITHWRAPGYITTDKQAQTARWGGYLKFNPETRIWNWVDPETGEKKARLEVTRPGLPYIPHRYYNSFVLKNPNVGFPLPGHVMTTSATGPGTDVWRKYKMESWEEYDRSLGEP